MDGSDEVVPGSIIIFAIPGGHCVVDRAYDGSPGSGVCSIVCTVALVCAARLRGDYVTCCEDGAFKDGFFGALYAKEDSCPIGVCLEGGVQEGGG